MGGIKRVKIEVTDLESNTVTIYNSIREAAWAIGKYHQPITKFFVYKQTTPYLIPPYPFTTTKVVGGGEGGGRKVYF